MENPLFASESSKQFTPCCFVMCEQFFSHLQPSGTPGHIIAVELCHVGRDALSSVGCTNAGQGIWAAQFGVQGFGLYSLAVRKRLCTNVTKIELLEFSIAPAFGLGWFFLIWLVFFILGV